MLKINVQDTSGILREFQLPAGTRRSMAKMVQQQLLAETYDKIVVLANRDLKTSKQEYIDGLVMNKNSIDLEGWLPNAIEDGVSGFDMKMGFQNSSKRKFTKTGGWYLTIPFRVYAPSSGSTYRNQMSWQIYRAVRAGKKYNAGPVGQRGAFTDKASGRLWEMYEHKSPILAGISKNTNERTGRSTYSTFRRVGDKSSPESWIHTGILAHRLFDKAWAQVDIEQVIENTLGGI